MNQNKYSAFYVNIFWGTKYSRYSFQIHDTSNSIYVIIHVEQKIIDFLLFWIVLDLMDNF